MTRIATTGVDHIDLCVGDLSRSKPFYDLVLTALGFHKVSDGDTNVWRNPHLEIGVRAARTPTDPDGYDRFRVGLHHLALIRPLDECRRVQPASGPVPFRNAKGRQCASLMA